MDAPPDARTSPTLLGRLRLAPMDQAAWDAFVHRYGRKIYSWCREWRLQEADAQDVTQAVLLKLADKMRNFTYDPAGSFRGWLKTVTRHTWSDLREAQQRHGVGSGGSEVLDRLQTVEAREDLVKCLEPRRPVVGRGLPESIHAPQEALEELNAFRAEAEALLGLSAKSRLPDK